MGPDGVELPIFELPLVLLPGELLPLHIFEDRYKRMIGRCLEDSEPFGIVFRDDEGGARRVGCEARVTEVTERFADGRLNIIVTGERPFSVLDRFDAPGYPAGEVEPVDPEAAEGGGEDVPAAQAARDAFAELVAPGRRRCARARGARARSTPTGSPARVELPPETKQRLLELRSEPERMRVLATALDTLIATVARSREIAERARMNGKLIIGDV